jgi:hypothetical protein
MKKAKQNGTATPKAQVVPGQAGSTAAVSNTVLIQRLADLENEQKRSRTDIDEMERRISELEEALSNVGRGAESPRARSTDEED